MKLNEVAKMLELDLTMIRQYIAGEAEKANIEKNRTNPQVDFQQIPCDMEISALRMLGISRAFDNHVRKIVISFTSEGKASVKMYGVWTGKIMGIAMRVMGERGKKALKAYNDSFRKGSEMGKFVSSLSKSDVKAHKQKKRELMKAAQAERAKIRTVQASEIVEQIKGGVDDIPHINLGAKTLEEAMSEVEEFEQKQNTDPGEIKILSDPTGQTSTTMELLEKCIVIPQPEDSDDEIGE